MESFFKDGYIFFLRNNLYPIKLYTKHFHVNHIKLQAPTQILGSNNFIVVYSKNSF